MPNTEQALFTYKHWKEIVNLVSDFNTTQSLWLTNLQPSVVSNKSTNIDSKLQNKTKPKPQKIVIEYETEIAMYKAITQQFSSLVTDNTQSFEVKSLVILKVRSLINVDISFIVCSNHDHPPEPMKTYYFQEV